LRVEYLLIYKNNIAIARAFVFYEEMFFLPNTGMCVSVVLTNTRFDRPSHSYSLKYSFALFCSAAAASLADFSPAK